MDMPTALDSVTGASDSVGVGKGDGGLSVGDRLSVAVAGGGVSVASGSGVLTWEQALAATSRAVPIMMTACFFIDLTLHRRGVADALDSYTGLSSTLLRA
jgi:hypothetical protein